MELKVFDWHRLLIGEAPASFLIEVLIRTLILYVLLLIMVRKLGKRMSGQLTILEFAIWIMLGAIISPAALTPETGIIAGALCLLTILLFQQGITWWGARYARFESRVQGDLNILLKDGVLQLRELQQAGIPRTQLFAILRKKKVYQLGELSRVYLEACGLFTVYHAPEQRPGLPILPLPQLSNEKFYDAAAQQVSCTSCGNSRPGIPDDGKVCDVCGREEWIPAVTIKAS